MGIGILCLRLDRSFGFRLGVLLFVGQNFEGINYGDRKLRDQMRAGFVDIGRRERKPAAVKAYAPPPIRAGEALIFDGVRLLAAVPSSSCGCRWSIFTARLFLFWKGGLVQANLRCHVHVVHCGVGVLLPHTYGQRGSLRT